MNLAILKGNCGQDPKITNFDNGGKTAQFSLCTSKPGYTKQDGTKVEPKAQWHNIVVKRTGLAGVCEQFVKKGTPLLGGGQKHETAPAPEPEPQPAPGNERDDLPF